MGSTEFIIQDKLRDLILEQVRGRRFGGAELGVEREYQVDNKRIDIVVLLKPQGIPILIIETKRKDLRVRSFEERVRLDPLGKPVIGQALCYAALVKVRFNLPVTPFFATANQDKFVLFSPIERIEDFVNLSKCKEGDYENALKPGAYTQLIEEHRVYIKQTFRSEDIQALLDDVARTWVRILKVYRPDLLDEELRRFRWPFEMWLINHLRAQFIDYLSEYFVTPYLRSRLAEDRGYYDELHRLAIKAGYRYGLVDIVGENLENVENLARMMLYVLLNKIIFYKVLEGYYQLLPLKPLLPTGVKSASKYLEELNNYFNVAVEVTGDFEAIFMTGLFDKLVLPDEEEVLRVIDTTIEILDSVKVEELGDVIGYIYEELIPPDERHRLGQFYTPPSIAELITRWSIRSPDDVVLDPGSGSGTFLVEAYKRLFELKTGKKYGESPPSKDVHVRILNQLFGIDINPFPAQLTAMNLAMRNPKVPSTNMNVVVADFFTIRPKQRILLPYKVRTPSGEVERVVDVPSEFDAVVGNPPYTRWVEIPRATQDAINKWLGDVIKEYDLTPQVSRGVEPGIYVYWIMHATKFLKEGGRLGMIMSNLWMQTDYGVNFGRFLLDHYRIRAIIDFTLRLFTALISTCIILAEKESDEKRRLENEVVFIHVPGTAESVDVHEMLKAIETKRSGRFYVKVIRQGDIPRDRKWVDVFFGAEERVRELFNHPLFTKLGDLFEPSYGNVKYLVLVSTGKLRGVRNPGSSEFHYLSPSRLRNHGLEKYAYPNVELKDAVIWPAITDARYAKYFTFTREDWENLRKEDKECYMFIGHVPKDKMPPEVANYVKLGETEIRTRIRGSRGGGRLASETEAAKTRARAKGMFYGWYDLGGVETAPIFAIYQAWYKTRFIRCEFPVAMYHALIAFIPKVELSEKQLKALLAYLNSSFAQYYIETHGRRSGGGIIGFEVNVAREMPVLDVRKLPEDKVEELARLFDELEGEARRIGGASEKEQIEELKPKIYEIDRAIAGILGISMDVVEVAERTVNTLVERRVSGAKAPAPSSVKGSEEPRRTRRRREGSGSSMSLDTFM